MQQLPSNRSTAVAELSDARRSLLEKFLKGSTDKTAPVPTSIKRRPAISTAPLSFAQERLWFMDQLLPGSAVFNVPLALPLNGPINEDLIELALNEIVRRHEVLRTTYVSDNGRPSLQVAAALTVPLQVVDVSDLDLEKARVKARDIIRHEAEQPFNLEFGPLIRAHLVRLNSEERILLVTLHHICSDGWSLVVLFEELASIYDAYQRQQPSWLPQLPIQYADYAAWQRDWLKGEVLEKQLGYWKEKLGGELPILELPGDRPRPAVQTYPGGRTSITLSEELTGSLQKLSRQQGATLFMTLLAAFNTLLYRHTGQQDIIIGSPIANRPQSSTEQLIGFFLNNLALRNDLSGNPTFVELLGRVRTTALEAYAHQDVPFEKLIEELKPERDLSRTTIFQIYFNLFSFAEEIKLPGGGGISFFEAWSQSEENLSKFDLTLYAGLTGKQLQLAFVYNTDLFDGETVVQMLDQFHVLLSAIAANPLERIATCKLIPTGPAIEIQPTNEFVPFEKAEIEQSITSRFATQVRKYGNKTAIQTKKFSWTYEELNRAANRVAHGIASARQGSESAALLFGHDAPMIAAMFGVLKSGRSYVPLDPSYPRDRLLEIVRDAEVDVIVCDNQHQKLATSIKLDGVPVVNIDKLSKQEAREINLASDPDALAYLLYTSGSTGKPKGVMQNHRNVLHFIRAYTNNLHLCDQDRLTLVSTYCFDASVMDIYGALLNGATLHPIDIKEEGFEGLRQRVAAERITIYHSTPTVYRHFVTDLIGKSSPHVRLVVLGGEQVTRSDVNAYKNHFSDDCLMINGLGPTESTVSLQYFINKKTRVTGNNVPVGFPVADTDVMLLDERGEVSALSGEIAIRSNHVALGYWRNETATTAAFKTYGDGPRLYRTGDVGRRLPDGSLLFTGRKDSQVKVRGFRIELNEIEIVIAQHRAVRECVVVAKGSDAEEKRLLAYVVTKKAKADEASLRAFVRSKLPDYMVPASFVFIEALPMTASGKINRLALPEPVIAEKTKRRIPLPSHAAVETVLAAMWADLLGREAVGVNENFFELGGHSLLAVLLFAQIVKYFGKRLPLATLFQAPTVAQLAAIIEEQDTPRWSTLVPIQTSGNKPPFFCVHAKGGNVLEFYELARHLGPDQPFYGLQSLGLDKGSQPHTRISEMAAHYLEEIRRVQPHGPYFIGGRSLGGTIAYEMACQLRDAGEEVGFLALLDTYPAGYLKLVPQSNRATNKLNRFRKRVKCHYANIAGESLPGQAQYVFEKIRYVPGRLKTLTWRRMYRLTKAAGTPLPASLRDVTEFNSLAAAEFVPRTYPGVVTLFWASGDRRASFDLVDGWQVLAQGGINVHEISGSHLNLIKEPYVGELASVLSVCLEQAQNQSQSSTRAATAKLA